MHHSSLVFVIWVLHVFEKQGWRSGESSKHCQGLWLQHFSTLLSQTDMVNTYLDNPFCNRKYLRVSQTKPTLSFSKSYKLPEEAEKLKKSWNRQIIHSSTSNCLISAMTPLQETNRMLSPNHPSYHCQKRAISSCHRITKGSHYLVPTGIKDLQLYAPEQDYISCWSCTERNLKWLPQRQINDPTDPSN